MQELVIELILEQGKVAIVGKRRKKRNSNRGEGVVAVKRKSDEMMVKVKVLVRKSVSGSGEEKSQKRQGNISTKRERKALSERARQRFNLTKLKFTR
jgi:hypothetical protein